MELIKKRFLRLFLFFILSFRLKSFKAAFYFSRSFRNFNFSEKLKIRWEKSVINFITLATRVHQNDLSVFQWDLMEICKTSRNFKINSVGDGKVEIALQNRGNSISVFAKSHETLFAVNEIFKDQIYDIDVDGNFILIDVGMNVGLASLYFSCYNNIDKIYAYEPFLQTYNLALENFNANSQLSSKILPINAGLGRSDIKISVPVLPAGHLGASTTDFVISNLNSEYVNTDEIVINNSVNEFDKILKQNSGKGVILKLDCEGAEYEIVEELYNAGLLDRIDIAIIEWHHNGKDKILSYFDMTKFYSISLNHDTFPVGMIYLFKRTN